VSRLVVVSNRVGLSIGHRKGAEGGLVSGLSRAVRYTNGLWFGWSGRTSERSCTEVKKHSLQGINFAVVDLSQKDRDAYYNGFANRSLWPLCHFRIDLAVFDRVYHEAYFRVNRLFAESLAPLLRPDDTIWIHDYHLIPLGAALRKLGVRQRIGFFLHVPWPSARLFLVLPRHRELVSAMFAYDLIGFQTKDDLVAFSDYVVTELSGSVLTPDLIYVSGRGVRLGVFPISVAAAEIAAAAGGPESAVHAKRMTDSIAHRKVILGVDRLDYSKGIDRRFLAYESLLDQFPDLRRQIVLLQIAPISRSDVNEYQDIHRELDGLAGHINGRFADYDWVPLRYVNRSYSRTALAGMYRVSRVGFVTPLRDGMNLVCKEFVAAQDPADPGVLILSRLAGAARELTDAIIVNPYDADDMVDALQTALEMSLHERRRRWEALMHTVASNDISKWQNTFVASLAEAAGNAA